MTRLTQEILVSCIAVGFLTSQAVAADSKKEARVTQIIRDVKLLPSDAAARPAAVNDKVSENTGVRTGGESRSELTFVDLTITRLGSNTIFSFNRAGHNAQLDSGSILLRVPKDSGGGLIKTSAVTVAVTGTTVIFESSRAGKSKLIVLEGGARASLVKHPAQSQVVLAGQMLDVPAGAATLPLPTNVDLNQIMKTHPLITDFGPLPSRDLIAAATAEAEATRLKGDVAKLTADEADARAKRNNDRLRAENARMQAAADARARADDAARRRAWAAAKAQEDAKLREDIAALKADAARRAQADAKDSATRAQADAKLKAEIEKLKADAAAKAQPPAAATPASTGPKTKPSVAPISTPTAAATPPPAALNPTPGAVATPRPGPSTGWTKAPTAPGAAAPAAADGTPASTGQAPEQAAKEQAAKEQTAKEQAAQKQADKEQAPAPSPDADADPDGQ